MAMPAKNTEAFELWTHVINQHEDPLKVSRAYYERAYLHFGQGAWLDGLVDLDLAEQHLAEDGEFSPRFHKIERPLTKTLGHIASKREPIRKNLLYRVGPGSPSDPYVAY